MHRGIYAGEWGGVKCFVPCGILALKFTFFDFHAKFVHQISTRCRQLTEKDLWDRYDAETFRKHLQSWPRNN